MNSDQENFDSLKKLLALKRHEQPPPRYFKELPGQIWSRIEADEMKPSFWERILPTFALKPSVAYAFGLLVCGTLIIGIGTSLNKTQQAAAPMTHKIVHQKTLQFHPSQPAFNQEGQSTNPLQPFYPGPLKLQIEPASYNPNGTTP